MKLSGPLDLKDINLFVLIENRNGGYKENYRLLAKIAAELKNVGLEHFLDFDFEGKYEFAKCKGCGDPWLVI